MMDTDRIFEYHDVVLNYCFRYPFVSFFEDVPDSLPFLIQPVLPTFKTKFTDDCVVMDISELAESVTQSRSFQILTCECGMPDDVGIMGCINVIHQEESVIWEFAIDDYRTLLSQPWEDMQDGRIRLYFERQKYQDAVRKLMDEIEQLLSVSVALADLIPEQFTSSYGWRDTLDEVQKKFPDCILNVELCFPYYLDSEDFSKLTLEYLS